MKISLLAIVILVFSFPVWAESFDYTQIKPEHFKKLEDKSEFTDKEGYHFRIENRDSSKGLYILENSNGSKRWKIHGVFYKYYKGKLTELITYSYGKKEGLREAYNRKGIVNFRHYYHLGRKHGSSEQFDDKGRLVEKCTYENGLKQGKLYSYSNGKVDFEKDYVDGKLHGEVLQYNSKGKIVARTTYNKGKRVGKRQRY